MRRVQARWRHLGGGSRWPGIATPRVMARTTGGCFVLGGLLVLALAAVAPGDFRQVEVVCLTAGIAVAVGIGVFVAGPRLGSWQFQVLAVLATALITITVYMAASPGSAVSVATLYVFVGFVAFFLPWPQTLAYLALVVVCCMAVLGHSAAVPWWSALIASSATVGMGAVIAVVGQMVLSAERDEVTGLPNRQGFDRLVTQAIDQAGTGGPRPAVVFLRLAVFDDVHHRLGHYAGDQLIRNTVASWRGVLGPQDVLARLGDKEFAVLLPGATEHAGVAVSHRMRAVLSVDCAAGVTAWQPKDSVAAMLGRTDMALRRAARGGPNRTTLESSGLPTMIAELADAIATDAVDVLYQPIVSLSDGNAVMGVEALARWQSPTRPDLSISEVITIAENSNLIAAFDRFVLRRACMDVQWLQQRCGDQRLTLTVNVSGLDLIEKGYAATVVDILAATGWPAGQLVLEVTESVVAVDTPASLAVLRELRAHGIRIAIDDFGTGYSTLSRLQTLPIDLLKLDASFTARSRLDPAGAAPPLLQAIAALARALELPLVIEGVETQAQAEALQGAGFTMAQGYLFGRPQERDQLAERLTVS